MGLDVKLPRVLEILRGQASRDGVGVFTQVRLRESLIPQGELGLMGICAIGPPSSAIVCLAAVIHDAHVEVWRDWLLNL